MPDTMTANAVAPVDAEEGFDPSVFDPSTWKEPVERIPVRVKVSRPKLSDPKYNKGTEFRPAFPHTGKGPEGDSITQWDLQLERLDAEYALLDGTRAPVIIYAGIDFQRMSKGRDGGYTLTGITKGRSKENLVMNAWTKLVGTLIPPSKIEGQMFLIDRYPQKEIASGFYAKNVCLPVQPLAPDFVYTEAKLVFPQKAKTAEDGDTTTTASQAASGFGGGVEDDPSVAAEKIGAFIRNNGITTLDTSLLGTAGFPDGCRIEPFVSSIARGTLVATLADFGVEV